MKRIIAYTIILLIMMNLFVGCKTTVPTIPIVVGGRTDYTIIRSDTDEEDNWRPAVTLYNCFLKCGVEVSIMTDWKNNPVSDYEIIVGKTERETERLYDRIYLGSEGFMIKVVDKKIYISGGGDKGTKSGVEYFMTEFLGYKGETEEVRAVGELLIPGDYEYIKRQEYGVKAVEIEEIQLDRFKLACDKTDDGELMNAVKEIQKIIYNQTGEWLEIIDYKDKGENKAVYISGEKPASGNFELNVKNGELIAAAKNMEIMLRGFSAFFDYISQTMNGEFKKEEGYNYMIKISEYGLEFPYIERVNFGQKFEPNGNYILHGAGQYYNGWDSEEKYREATGSSPVLSMSYVNLNGYDSTSYISLLKNRLASHDYLIPQIALMFCNGERPETAYDHLLAETDQYDAVLDLFIEGLKSLEHPVFLRPGYNFNGEWNGYGAETFKASFRKIAAAIDRLGADNIALTWDYAPGAADKDYMKYYPGDDVVDWWSINIWNASDMSMPNTLDFLQDAKIHCKPVIISETTAHGCGTTKDNSWELWFLPYFNFIKNNPVIKASCYINWEWDIIPMFANWGAGDCRLEVAAEIASRFAAELQNSIWLGDVGKDTLMDIIGD